MSSTSRRPLLSLCRLPISESKFDILTAIEDLQSQYGELIESDSPSSNIITFRCPTYVRASFRRVVSHYSDQHISIGQCLSVCLDYGIESILPCESLELFKFNLTQMENVESLSPSDEATLDQLISFHLPIRDEYNTGIVKVSFRCHPHIRQKLLSLSSTIRTSVMSITCPLISFGLSGQPNVNPLSSDAMNRMFTELETSLSDRAEMLNRILQGLVR